MRDILRFGLRLRIAAAFAVICIAVVFGLGLALLAASNAMEEALVEQIVHEEMDFLVQRYLASGELAPAPGPNVQYYIARNAAERSHLPPAIAGLAPGPHDIGTGAEEKHVAIRDTNGVRFVVVYDAGAHELREARFQTLLVFMLGTVIVVSLLLGHWIAGVLTRQLSDLGSRVAALAPEEPHALLQRPDQDHEVAQLAQVFDDYHARFLDMIRREQEFTANVSHELRTPLTAIRTSCELLLADDALREPQRKRVDMIEQAAQRMGLQIDALLALARGGGYSRRETVDLAACVHAAADHYRDDMTAKDIEFRMEITSGTTVSANRAALELVLANLLRNAVQHTRHGFIGVRFHDGALTVTDSGKGIAAADLPRVFERFYRADDGRGGYGIGLAIVKRICDELDWQISVSSAPGTGSAFSIALS